MMTPGDNDDNFSFPLIEMLDQVFEETLEEVNNHNKTGDEADLHYMENQVKVNIIECRIFCNYLDIMKL